MCCFCENRAIDGSCCSLERVHRRSGCCCCCRFCRGFCVAKMPTNAMSEPTAAYRWIKQRRHRFGFASKTQREQSLDSIDREKSAQRPICDRQTLKTTCLATVRTTPRSCLCRSPSFHRDRFLFLHTNSFLCVVCVCSSNCTTQSNQTTLVTYSIIAPYKMFLFRQPCKEIDRRKKVVYFCFSPDFDLLHSRADTSLPLT